MKAVFEREISSYFTTMLGYIFIAIHIALCTINFASNNIIGGSASFSAIAETASIMFVFIIPILTMRSFAEEKKSRSDQLLLTSPVSVSGIVAGKFLSAFCVLLIALAVMLVFPVTLYIFGNPYIGEIAAGYIGMILIGAAFISIGMFISSITENQLIACIITMGILFLLWMSNGYISAVSNTVLYTILSSMSLYAQVSSFFRSVLNLASVVYFITLTLLFLFLTAKAVERRRWSRS